MEKCDKCVHYDACLRLISTESEELIVCDLFEDKSSYVKITRCMNCERYLKAIPSRGEVPEGGFCLSPYEPVKFVLGNEYCFRGKGKVV